MRISLDLLKLQARSYGIKVDYSELPTGLLGKADAGTKTITLSLSMWDYPRQHICVLAEEIGHILFPPRPGHISYHSENFYQTENCSTIKNTVAQDERKARDWATSVLLGHVDFDRIKEIGASSIGELAEYFDVEPWFIEHRVGWLRRKARDAGQKVKWREFIRRV